MGISKSYLKDKFLSKDGYKRNSPDVNRPYNVIPSNQITMEGVDFPVMGIDDIGNQQMMYPGNNYTFPGNYVTEFPVKNMGNKRFGQVGFQNRGEISTEKSPLEMPYVEIRAKRNPLTRVKPYKWDPNARSPLAKNTQPQDQLRTQYYRKPEEQMAGISETKKEDLRRKISGVLRETTQADKDWAAEQANRKALTFSGASDGSVLGGMLDLVNPFSYYYAGKDAVRGAGETAQAIYEGNPDAVAAGLFKTGLNAAAFLPATQVGKFANAIGTEARLINRLKPLSVQRNLGDISKEAYKSLGRKAYQEAARNPFNVSEYLATQTPLKNIIKTPFKSEIDWAKWNPDTSKYPELINEYNAIEQSTKKAGTWMKNPDGSAFQGTPEQFIQQQSSYFKKAFPSPLRDEAGNVQFTYHGSPNTFDVFDENMVLTGRTRGHGIYTSPSKEKAASYAKGKDGKLYEFYQNASKKQDKLANLEKESNERFAQFLKDNPKNSPDFDKKFKAFMDEEDKFYNALDLKEFKLQPGYDFYKANADEYVVPFTNYPKSAAGNVGFFDMTNPNIYKSVLPYAIPTSLGVGALQQYYNQKPKGTYQMGGTMSIPGVNGQVVSSGPQPLTSVKKTRGPINKTKKGDVKTMPTKAVKKILKNIK